MKLDFTGLDSLRQTPPNKAALEPLEHPKLAPKEGNKGQDDPPKANAPEPEKSASNSLQRSADWRKVELERAREICREYQEAIREAGTLQAEITKGVVNGEDIYRLFLKAVKALSLTTANNAFYDQTRKDLTAIRGRGLLETPALKIELQDTQERLQRLKKSEAREKPEGEEKERIKRAIKAHDSKIKELEGLIGAV